MGWPPALLTPVPAADIARGDGELVTDFIEAMCPQVKDSIGGRAGEPLILRDWQRDLFGHLFARRADDRLRHKVALVWPCAQKRQERPRFGHRALWTHHGAAWR
jgi:hypothetical protein